MSEYSITSILNKLNSYDDQISNSITELNVTGIRKLDCKIDGLHEPKVFENNAKSQVDKVEKLLKNRIIIKAALVKSNAQTIISIGDIKMTVAEALEYKNSIKYDKSYLNKLKSNLAESQSQISDENIEVERYINQIILKRQEKEKSEDKKDNDNKYANDYKRYNEYTLFNPINIETKIEKLEAKILNFEENINVALQESNALTKIELDL